MGRYAQSKRRGGLTRQAAAVVQTPPVPDVDWDAFDDGGMHLGVEGLGTDPYGGGYIAFEWSPTGAGSWSAPQRVTVFAAYSFNVHDVGFFDARAAWSNGVSETSAWSSTVTVEVTN